MAKGVALTFAFLLLIFQFTCAIPANGDFTEVTLSLPVITDSNYKELAGALVGQQIIISVGIANLSPSALEYLLVTEVRTEEGITQFLQPRWARVGSDDKVQLNHVWRPEEAGSYQVRSFLTSADCNPEAFTSVRTVEVIVRLLDIGQKVVPPLEGIAREAGKHFTFEEVEAIELEDIRRDEIRAEAEDAALIRMEEKERRIRELIWSDERIVEYQKTVEIFGYDSHFAMDESFCDNAEMTIPLTRERNATGDWQTSYVTTLSGRSELYVTVVDGKIRSIVDNPLNDTTLVHTFTDQQKKAIQIALGDGRVEALFRGKDVEVRVRDFGLAFDGCEEKCAIVSIHVKENDEKQAAVLLDISNERALSVRPSAKWISKEPERALAAVEEGQYRIEVSFNRPIDKHNYTKMEREHNLEISYLEYAATQNVTGGASMEFTTLEKLENDLAVRHGASLVGVTKIVARGESVDWLDFYRQMRSSISDFTVLQVLY